MRGTTSSTPEWTQETNTRSDCITGNIISWPGGSVIRESDGTTTAISATELNANGFPYCLTLLVTVTPNTPVGPLTSGASSASVLFQDPSKYCNNFIRCLFYLSILDLVMPVVSAEFSLLSNGSFQITVSWQVSSNFDFDLFLSCHLYCSVTAHRYQQSNC